MIMMNNTMTTDPSSTAVSGGAHNLFLHLSRHVRPSELILAAVVFAALHALRLRKRGERGPPADWPILGMLPSLAAAVRSGDVYEWMTAVLLRSSGGGAATFRFRGPRLSSLNCVVTADPRNLEYLLKSKFANFPKGPYFRDTVRDLLGDGIFGADGDTWRSQRKTASIEFHSAKFRALTLDSLVELVHARLLPVLDQTLTTPDSNGYIDLQEILLRLTFDNVCMIAFGVDPGCLREGLPQIPFAKAFEDATEATVSRFVMPTCVWKAMRHLNVGPERKLREAIKAVDEFAEGVIGTRKRELVDPDVSKRSSDLLTIFMGLRDEDGREYSDKFLRDICVNFILAGRDTSSVALSWFFWLVDNNPEVEEKILQEICGVVRERYNNNNDNNNNNDDSDEKVMSCDESEVVFRAEEIKKMDYLQAAISEALRLYPSVPVDHKEVVEDDKFPDGTELKKGTKIIYAIYSMGRMEHIWGKDCREFKPQRWLRDSDGRYVSESAYKFAAFNGGPRLCLGKDFAYFQMKFVAASIMYRYHVHVAKDHTVVPKLALTMYMKYGLKVSLRKRQRSDLRNYFLTKNSL